LRLLTVIIVASIAAAAPLAGSKEVPDVPVELENIPILLLVDLSSGQTIVERDADRRFVPASITKVMTAFTAFEMLKSGELKPTERFGIRPSTFLQWRQKGSTMFLPAEADVSVAELLQGITTVSANDGSIVLAEGATGSVDNWVTQMNFNARRIGMSNSHFGTPNGWPDEGRTFTNARDLVALGRALIERHPNFYARYFGNHELTFNGITQRNHDPMLGRIDGADGIKTGFTNQSGYGFLGSAQRSGRRLIVVVAGAELARDRDRAARALIEWGFEAFETRPVRGGVAEIAHARVQNGSKGEVQLTGKALEYVTIPTDSEPNITLKIHYDGPLRAPIIAGTKVAELEIAVEGMPTSRTPLFAEEDIYEAGFLRQIWNGIIGWMT
jgi:D-alanyl-D-alanine carboxypeptidase (penicillin-binding protein 5/6)